jgi:hypothetical protein
MANVLFISETFLKDNTLLHENIDFKYLRPVVLMCQDIHIQHKIGTTLYNELKTQITNSTLTGCEPYTVGGLHPAFFVVLGASRSTDSH